MKYAFMSFSAPNASLDELLAMAEEYGYDGIEPRIQADHGHGIEIDLLPDERQAVADEVADSRIAICCIATSCRFANPDDSVETLHTAHDAIDLAGDLGCPRLRVFGGAITKGLRRDQIVGFMAASLSEIAGHAAERGVTICVETHDDWCDPNHLAMVMNKVNHPNIAINWDIMHPVRQENYTIEASFEILEPWVQHVHVHDGVAAGNLEFQPIGEGAIDHLAALTCLSRVGYAGYVSGEWINWTPAEKHLPQELQTLKRLAAQAG